MSWSAHSVLSLKYRPAVGSANATAARILIITPPVLGSKGVTELLTAGLTDVIGGKFYVETDPLKAAQGLITDIRAKRKNLGLPN